MGVCVWSLFCCSILCVLLLCNHLDGEERAGCFTLTVFLMSSAVSVLWLFLTVLWVSLQKVIVLFPDYTQLLFWSLDLFVCTFIWVFLFFCLSKRVVWLNLYM